MIVLSEFQKREKFFINLNKFFLFLLLTLIMIYSIESKLHKEKILCKNLMDLIVSMNGSQSIRNQDFITSDDCYVWAMFVEFLAKIRLFSKIFFSSEMSITLQIDWSVTISGRTGELFGQSDSDGLVMLCSIT